MLTIHELLEDPVYKEWFLKKPVLPPTPKPSPPWRLYVQRNPSGNWSKKDFDTYKEAFALFKKMRSSIHDATIQSKAVAFAPPLRFARIKGKFLEGSDGVVRQATKRVPWKPKLPADEAQHHWCPYCRRPTVFLWFASHHAYRDGKIMAADDSTRCTICGIRLTSIRRQW